MYKLASNLACKNKSNPIIESQLIKISPTIHFIVRFIVITSYICSIWFYLKYLIIIFIKELVIIVRYYDKDLYKVIRHYGHFAAFTRWLGRWNDFRTFNWVENIECPEALIDKTQKLLVIAA